MVATPERLQSRDRPLEEQRLLYPPGGVLPDGMEWVNGELIEKTGMTLKTGRIQIELATRWNNYKDSQNLGGAVYSEAPCRTQRQTRRPDIAYLTPELLAQLGEPAVLPQSFPLIAEIISPTDLAEDIFSKANEYLASGGEEVWLVLPESQWVAVVTQTTRSLFSPSDTATSQVLPGFQAAIADLLG